MVTALITGASSGIGEQFAYELSANGFHVIAVARRKERLEQVVSRIEKNGGSAEYIVADLVSSEDVRTLSTFIRSSKVDMLINNAGFGGYGLFHTIDSKREEEMIALNIAALTQLTRAAIDSMLARKTGTIINVASTAAFQPVPYMAVYAATKSFVLHYTEAIAAELKRSGIHVMALCPGGTATEFGDRAQVKGGLSKQLTMTPEEVVKEALKGVQKRKTVVVPGSKNIVMSKGYRFIPRQLLVNSLARFFNEKKSDG